MESPPENLATAPVFASPPRPRRVWLIVLLWVAGVVVALVGTLAFLGYRYATATPQPHPGFGHQVKIKDHEAGWATYRFPDLDLRVDLPASPVPTSYPIPRGANLYTEGWSNYAVRGKRIQVVINEIWYRYGRSADLAGSERVFDAWRLKNFKDVQNVVHEDTSFMGYPAIDTTSTLTYGGKRQYAWLLLCELPGRQIYIGGQGDLNDKLEVISEWRRVLGSVRPQWDSPDTQDRNLDDILPALAPKDLRASPDSVPSSPN